MNGNLNLINSELRAGELRRRAEEWRRSRARIPNDSPGAVPQLASLDREIIVPEIPEGQSAEAVDLGILELAHPQDRASAQ